MGKLMKMFLFYLSSCPHYTRNVVAKKFFRTFMRHNIKRAKILIYHYIICIIKTYMIGIFDCQLK
jgi:hypothetical protein